MQLIIGQPRLRISVGLLLYWNRRVLGKKVSAGQNVDVWWYGDSETLDFLVDGYRPDTFWFEEVDEVFL
jgi:hypothetical protein